jgi:hypothetical protein
MGADNESGQTLGGASDFDFIIGDWDVCLKKLVSPLTGSTTWIEYEGTSKIRKMWGTSANSEEFDVHNAAHDLRIKGQTLRLYNPDTHQWSIYLVNADKGVLSLPPVVGKFADGVGEFYDQEDFKGKAIFVRFVWRAPSPDAARMEQSFSEDGGKTWEVNWICDLTRSLALRS